MPVIKEQYFTLEYIVEYLNNGIPIIAIFDPAKKPMIDNHWSFNALLAAEMNGLQPSIGMYRKEGPFLCNYKAYKFEGDPIYHFMLYQIFEMKNSNIMELINSDFREATELYLDLKNWCENQMFFAHDFTENEGLEFFQTHPKERFIHIGKERLIRVDNTEKEE